MTPLARRGGAMRFLALGGGGSGQTMGAAFDRLMAPSFAPPAGHDPVPWPLGQPATEGGGDQLLAWSVQGEGVRLALPPSRNLAAWIGALLLHAAPLLLIALAPVPQGVGAGGVSFDSVSVEIIEAAALETSAPLVRSDGGAAGANADKSGIEGVETQPEITAAVPRLEIEVPVPPPEALMRPDEIVTVPPDLAAAEVIRDTPLSRPELDDLVTERVVEEPSERTERKEPDAGHAERRREAQRALVAGGAASRSAESSIDAAAAATATAGAVGRYAMEVRLALGRASLLHRGRAGRVVVRFGLDEKGGVRFAAVDRSSGDANIDAAATAGVLGTRFPAPPAGMNDAQLTYVVPFDFK